MKVKQLIKLLQKENLEAEAYVSSDGVNYEIAVEVDEDDDDVVILGEVSQIF